MRIVERVSRRWIFFALVAIQVLVPVGMVAAHEHAISSGKKILVKAQPIDPEDFFRGQYVELRYQFSTVPATGSVAAGQTIYVILHEGDNGVWSGVFASTHRPSEDLLASRDLVVIRGKATYDAQRGEEVSVIYGVETLYVEEGQGPRLEQATSAGRLYVRLSIASSGKATIAGTELRGGE